MKDGCIFTNHILIDLALGLNLPELHDGDILRNVVVTMDEKFTQPPSRFNQASLLEEMEKEKIGTKATRSEIISTLFKRNYITGTYSQVMGEVELRLRISDLK